MLGVEGAPEAEQAAAQEQVRQRTEGNGRARHGEAAQLVARQPDTVPGNEFRCQEAVFGMHRRVIGAIRELGVHKPHLGGVLGDVGVDPAVRVLLLELPAAFEHLG